MEVLFKLTLRIKRGSKKEGRENKSTNFVLPNNNRASSTLKWERTKSCFVHEES